MMLNKNVVKGIMSFSLVILILSVYLFYITKITDTTFLVNCLTIFFSSLVFCSCILSLYFIYKSIDKKKMVICLSLFLMILLVLIVVKFII